MSTAPIIDENYVPKRVELDRYKMELGPEGLKDYFWPLSFQERKSFAKDLVGGLPKYCAILLRLWLARIS